MPDPLLPRRPIKGATRKTLRADGYSHHLRRPWLKALLLAPLFVAGLAAYLVFEGNGHDSGTAQAVEGSPDAEVSSVSPEVGGLEEETASVAAAESEELAWTKVKIRRGDTLSHIFARLGMNRDEALRIVNSNPEAEVLSRLIPGQALKVRADAEGLVEALIYRINGTDSLRVERVAEGFAVSRETRQFDLVRREVNGVISSSLFLDGQKAGLPDVLIMQLADIFGWDIDFALDLRVGDSFSVIHEEKHWEGQKAGDGPILAAQFVNQGRTYRAIGYRDANGVISYYTPEGRSLRRAFLRSPLKVSRITSGFSSGRFHPVLKRWRKHQGVDYGAPTGTPVMATSNGQVAFVGNKGGYGRTVILKHGGSYTTLYAHLSRFRKGIRTGKKVEQGEIIGYVGKTGLATGPHLHYEFQVAGRHRNPLTFKFPQAEPIPSSAKKTFLAAAEQYTARLDLLRQELVAANP